jgi:CHRD domain
MKNLKVQGLVLAATPLVAAAAILALASLAAADGGKTQVKSDPLTGYQETPGVSSAGTGSFSAVIDDGAQTIDYTLSYSDLSSPAIFAHIHFGNRFIAGAVSAFLCGGGGKPACPNGTSSQATVTGTITAADVIGPAAQGIAPGEFSELVRAIRAGMTYANVHSTPFPAGEIRGQINDDNQRQP